MDHTHTHTQTQQQHTVAPANNSNDKASPTGVGSRDFDIIGCIFNGIIDDKTIGTSGMCILYFVLFWCEQVVIFFVFCLLVFCFLLIRRSSN